MIIVTDQHHMNTLERKVIESYGETEKIVLMGDFSINKVYARKKKPGESLLKQAQIDYKKERQLGLVELPFNEKQDAHQEGIIKAATQDHKRFLAFVGLYGGGSNSEFSKKIFYS